MTSALTLFRRAANIIARLEDALVFNGLQRIRPRRRRKRPATLPHGAPDKGEQIWGGEASGLLIDANDCDHPYADPTAERTGLQRRQ